MPKKPKRPHDFNQLAKLLTEQATGEAAPSTNPDEKNPAAVALGRLGGLKGGVARSKSLSKKRRSEISKKAARVRWDK